MPATPDEFSLTPSPAQTQETLNLPKPAPASKPERRKKDSVRLVWDSKPKRPPSPRDIEFQTAEVVIPNPSRDEANLPFATQTDLLAGTDIDRSKMNRLIWGDNLLAMQAMLAQGYEAKIDLIYIDPPFDSKADYSHRLKIGGTEVMKEPSVIERLAYTDTWEGGSDSYLDMLYPRLQLMKRLLTETGSIYVHIGSNISHYVKVMLDEVYGVDNYRNQITWKRTFAHSDANRFGIVDDTIFFYTKSDKYFFKTQFKPHSDEYKKSHYGQADKDGRRFRLVTLSGAGPGPARKFNDKIIAPPPGRHWAWSQDRIDEALKSGKIVFASTGQPNIKQYLDETSGTVIQTIWDDIAPVNPISAELLGFQTQKPEALLERILNASSQEGDLVADFFCGSGTTAAVAEKLSRRWISSDLGKVGIQVTRGRLVNQDAKPFLIENIGNYQREMIYLTGGRIFEMQKIILKLYGATPHPNYPDLGTRTIDGTTELVYVGYPDRPTTAKKAEELMTLAESLDGPGYKRLVILAWDYDYNFDAEWEHRLAARKGKSKVDVQRKMIPPDIYDYLKKAKTEDDIYKLAAAVQFHEKPYLKLAKPKLGKPDKEGNVEVTIAIDKYVLFDLPVDEKEQPKLREAIKDNFALLIDYWAVDWTHDNRTFRSQWQAIRGNGKRATVVPTATTHTYAKSELKEKPTIAIRVVDVFGNDATATLNL